MNLPIGLFDSGLGGLTVLRECRKALPRERFLYLGDLARSPYGSKGSGTVIRYAKECAGFLLEQDVKLVVVACNTASALALEALREFSRVPVLSTIEAAVDAVMTGEQASRIGVIGTEATVASDAYGQALLDRDPSLRVFSHACPLFVALVESGLFEGELVDKAIAHHLSELRECKIDTLVLACTHYPLLANPLKRFFGEEVRVVECSQALASQVKLQLAHDQLETDSQDGSVSYFVTDEISRFNALAKKCMDDGGVCAIHVDL